MFQGRCRQRYDDLLDLLAGFDRTTASFRRTESTKAWASATRGGDVHGASLRLFRRPFIGEPCVSALRRLERTETPMAFYHLSLIHI